MRVREGMSETVLTIGPSRTLRDAAEVMCRRNVGAAVVLDPDAPGPSVITERDILQAVGCGEDPDRELVGDHVSSHLTLASPDWSLERAAATMVRGRFRHLVVYEHGELVGILSMRDIMRCWTQDGATSDLPAEAQT